MQSSPSPFFDLAALLEPIAIEQPCGPDMLLSTDFDEIQTARQQDDMSLDQGEWVTDRKEADLPFVVQRCTQLLHKQTKDLRLAIWLTDALASQHGLSGLSQGYALLDALTSRYWDNVHPAPEDGDMSARIGNIGWFLKRTVEQLERAPLLRTGSTHISMLAWQTAVALDQAVRRQPSESHEILRGKVTLEELERQRTQAPSSQLRTLVPLLDQCRTALTAFEHTLDTKLGAEAPSFSAVRETLDQLQHLVRRWGGNELSNSTLPTPATTHVVSPTATPDSTLTTPVHTHTGAPQALLTRADAIALLQQAATFFERTEPSSPAAYMAKKAAHWAQLPLHEWLKHVVKSNDELAQLEEMLGVTSHARVTPQ
ncbi:MAG: type VI secretion system protein TssA [Acidovorax sp.]|jgi:type VI secretion system protein ImpA|nr:type VI secretion system protein TssA [Acidovorax sp.]